MAAVSGTPDGRRALRAPPRMTQTGHDDASGCFLERHFQPRAGGLTFRLLAESHLERHIGKIQTQGHQCHDDGNKEETQTDDQHMFHVRRTPLAGKCVQGFLLCARAAQ